MATHSRNWRHGDIEPRPGISLADLPLGVRPCSLAAALDVLGERWSLLALGEIGYGVHRFALMTLGR
jgi:DNA-binding HxlR family transcriptional regulator